MKKTLLFFTAVFFGGCTMAQKYSSKTGKVSFEASVPMFEDVEAKDNSNVVILNSDTGEIASVSNVKNFKFSNSLMQEHFNESYAETSKYPKATFKGKISNFDKSKLANSAKYTIQGTLNFHGVDRAVSSSATIYSKDGKIFISGSFVARTADYNVTIPKMVTKKIAENVNVEYDYTLVKQ